jgi:heat shock protein 5
MRYLIRRLLGRNFSDPQFQAEIKDFPYDVLEKDGRPMVKMQIKGKDAYFAPEEIVAKVFEKMKYMAETHLNQAVNHAIVTVHALFNDTQRQATKDAALIAKLNILRLVNEPIAAGVAYGLECRDECFYIIYNPGEKQADVALISVDFGVYDILALAEDNLVGSGFENLLLDHVIKQFNNENKVDITTNVWAHEELISEVVKAEKTLLAHPSAKIEIPARNGFNGFSATIAQIQLENLKKESSDRIINMIKKLLGDAKVEKEEINGIIFTGSSAHIAKVQPFVETYLGKKALSREDIGPDEAVVRGATIHGHLLTSYDEVCPSLVDVARLGLGIETSGGVFTPLILRNTVIPTRKMLHFSTVMDSQEKVLIRVLEGERIVANKNRLLGTLELTDLLRKPKGVPDIEVVFEMDPNEDLTVVARERESGKDAKLVVKGNRDRYDTWVEIDEIIIEADRLYKEDELLLKELARELENGNEENGFGLVVI